MNGNDIMAMILRSPLHGLLSGSTVLVTVTGRKSGRAITLPVNYVADGDTLWVLSGRDRTWWKNLRGGAAVGLYLKGREVAARGETVEDPPAVAGALKVYLKAIPLAARSLGIKVQGGAADPVDLGRAAAERVFVRLLLIT
jgi:hypothetical protein